jgi:hypothetical protein
MSNVARLSDHPKRKAARRLLPSTSEAFERAWPAFPESGRKRSSRIEAWPEWQIVADAIGEDKLEQACLAFSKSKVEDCGAPGFHRWLRWGRWEHWLIGTAPVQMRPKRFADESLRQSFFARFEDERARAWLDKSDWIEAMREIVAPSPPRQAWMEGPFTRWAKENDIRALNYGGRS